MLLWANSRPHRLKALDACLHLCLNMSIRVAWLYQLLYIEFFNELFIWLQHVVLKDLSSKCSLSHFLEQKSQCACKFRLLDSMQKSPSATVAVSYSSAGVLQDEWQEQRFSCFACACASVCVSVCACVIIFLDLMLSFLAEISSH